MREEFEEWALPRHYDLTWSNIINNYNILSTRCVWDAWQASRTTQVVELPASVYRANEYHIEYTGEVVKEYDEYYEIEDIKNALEQAGVRFK